MRIRSLLRMIRLVTPALLGFVVFSGPAPALGREKPNIVLVFMDNFGYGELGCYGGGILRGAPTPRIDRLAEEGMRLLNFNVEAQCTPSRAALMTGRFAIRTGNASVPIDTPVYGLVQWEITMAEMLAGKGYATGMYGKWHLGHTEGRFPTDQGFDEWYGIPNSSDESFWPDLPEYEPDSDPFAHPAYVMEGRKGEDPKRIRVYDQEQRKLIDQELVVRTIDFMKRQAKAGRPFFAFVPLTQTHMPVVPHPDFKGKTGNGDWADVLAQLDHQCGMLLDTIDELGIQEDTIFIFTSDNGPEMVFPWHGSSGPWRGSYFTHLEGSLRVPFIIRWPGRVPAGAVSNEIVHLVDLFPTFARLVGVEVPKDRCIDGVDQLDFLLGKQQQSNRLGFPVFVGERLQAFKWKNWKFHFYEQEKGFDIVEQYPVPRLFNLLTDPKEEHNIIIPHTWVRWPMMRMLTDFKKSMKECPPIRPGTPDPYRPAKR